VSSEERDRNKNFSAADPVALGPTRLSRSLRVLLKPFPRRWVGLLGWPLGFLWYDVFRLRRKVVLQNLERAFPDWSLQKKIQVGRKSVHLLTRNFFEFFLIPRIDKKWLDQNVIFEGLENLDRALAMNKGAYLLGLHLGHGDMMASCLSVKGYRVSIITKFFKNDFLNRLWFGVRGAQGVECIPPHGEKTPFMILKALKTQRLVGFVLDQHMGKPYGLRTTFFGHPAGTAYGLALFHLKTKSPIVPVYNFEGVDGRLHIVAEEPIFYDPRVETQNREQTLVELTQRSTDKIEEIVRRYPEHWMWVHRRWKWKGP
jgi:KDO2-lipid IV(A) lauroyltransferase